MSYSPSGGFVKDSNNSTTSTLTASSTFTGTATDVLGYNQIHVTMKMSPNVLPDGDANTAAGSMYVEFSPDGTNWDISIPLHVRSGIFIPQTYVVVERYFRIRYINDGGAAAITDLGTGESADTARNQTAFRLNAYLGYAGTKELGRTIDQSVTGSDPVSVVRAVLMGKNPDGNYVNATSTTDNEVLVSNSESDANVFTTISDSSVSTTTYYMLVDLSDTSGFAHDNTGRIDLSYLKVVIDPASNSVGAVRVGVITRVDGTDADVSYVFNVPFGKSPSKILSINNFSPSQLKLGVTGGALNFAITDTEDTNNTAINTGGTLTTPIGTATPAVGDVIVKLVHTSGSDWSARVECFYHSHTTAS